MKPPPGHERKLAEIAAREGRHNVPRDMWTERDWRVQREHGSRAACPQSRADRQHGSPAFIPATLAVAAGFSLHDRTADEERQRRIAANRALEKAGVRPRPWR